MNDISNTNKIIEVIIPAYNCSSTLPTTLCSLVSQIDKNFKVLVIDDCSIEDIYSIVKQFENILDIRYIRNENNVGCGMSRQTGIDNAVGDYIIFLDSDDVFMPYTISIFNEMIKMKPDVDLFHSYFYSDENIDDMRILKIIKEGFTWCHGKLYKKSFIDKYQIKNSSLVKYADDSFFNSMCSELTIPQLIPTPMMIWCNNQKSITRKTPEKYRNESLADFILAMCLSLEFISQYKNIKDVIWLHDTTEYIKNKYKKSYDMITDDEKEKVDINLSKFKNLLSENNIEFVME